jgi:protein-S-isoprenylcysteine O-methyltransferase Ste14
MHGESAYGLWSLVIINSAIFIIFAFSFTKPKTSRDWRSLGVFSAFIVALFTEMYGFPLTIYLLSGWLTQNYPGIDFLSHENGHLWHTILGLEGNSHFDILHILSNIFILAGFWLLASAWNVLYKAQQSDNLALTGPYAYLRHPQYSGFIIIMFGFLLQWPTLPTLVMFPILVYVYAQLAKREEREALAMFENEYRNYMNEVPGFIPQFKPGTIET